MLQSDTPAPLSKQLKGNLMDNDEDELTFTEEEVEEIAEKLRVARASVPVYCRRCRAKIPRFRFWNLNDALQVTLEGGYAMFMDEPDWKFALCKVCCYDLVHFLNIDIDELSEEWGKK